MTQILIPLMSLFVMVAAEAGSKAKWTLEVFDAYDLSKPDSMLYSRQTTWALLSNGARAQFGGSYFPLHPKGRPTETTGDFELKIAGVDGRQTLHFFRAYDRTRAPQKGYNSVFEVDGRMKVGERQRIYFTHGDFAAGNATRYLIHLTLDSLEPCDDDTTCFQP